MAFHIPGTNPDAFFDKAYEKLLDASESASFRPSDVLREFLQEQGIDPQGNYRPFLSSLEEYRGHALRADGIVDLSKL